jgi:hypothetical protein
VWDNAGDTVWGIIEIDTVLGRMAIGVDSTWMANANYPVTIDPTFGRTDVAASNKTLSNRARGSEFTTSEDGTGDSITIYVDAACEIGGAVYDDNSSLPGNMVDTSTLYESPSSGGWVSFTSAETPSYTASTIYHIMGVDAGTDPVMRWDTDAGIGSWWPDTWPLSDPAPAPTASDKRYSIYVTYTATGGGAELFRRRRLLEIKR